jgi:hypothetical protein
VEINEGATRPLTPSQGCRPGPAKSLVVESNAFEDEVDQDEVIKMKLIKMK